jgi:hypothetical protein
VVNVGVLGTIDSPFLSPGVSKNGRYYTPELIEDAVARMRDRLADPDGLPITMLSHHGAGDDSTQLCARVTDVRLDTDTHEASLYGYLIDTRAGRDIAAATEPGPDGKRVLDGVSIRGWWLGPVRTIEVDGQQVEIADGLEVDGVDFTKSPGVAAARIAKADRVASESAGQRTPITETVEVHVMPDKLSRTEKTSTGEEVTPSGTSTPAGVIEGAMSSHSTATSDAAWDGPKNEANLKNDAGAKVLKEAYAWQDPDGDPDKKASYKFIHHFVGEDGAVGAASTKAASSGIAVLNGGRGGTTIPDGDRKKVHAHLAKHLSDAGKEVPELESAESAHDTAQQTLFDNDGTERTGLGEALEQMGLTSEAFLAISAMQGPADVDVSAFGIPNADLAAAATQLGLAADAALKTLDPDEDGDLDLPGDEGGGEDVTACPSCGVDPPVDAVYCPACGTKLPDDEDDTSETRDVRRPAVAEQRSTKTTKTTEETGTTTEPAQALTAEDRQDIADRLAAALKPAGQEQQPTEPAESTEEMEARISETVASRVEDAVAERVDALRKSMLETYGPPRRKGLVEAATDQSEPPELHKMDSDEFRKYAAAQWDKVLGPVGAE